VPCLVDTHAHLDEIEDIGTALQGARRTGVEAIIAVGQDIESNKKILNLAADHPLFIYAALGLHPWALGRLEPAQIEQTIKFLEDNLCHAVALGEVGLDYDKRVLKGAGKELQKEVLKKLLELVREHDKPVSLHSRYAWKDCLQAVKEAGIRKVVFHWYTGFSSTLAEIIEAGYFISATPAAEYHEEQRRAIKEAPAGQLLLETDCPVHYGRENKYRSQPSDVVRSLRAAAQIKGMDENELARQTMLNARRLFGL